MDLIRQMLDRHNYSSYDDYSRAFREVMQELALAGLYRAGFFGKAAFYGGTCLRIFHGLDRFSEDLDFSLLQPDKHFSLEPYMQAVKTEFAAHGLDVHITYRKKLSQIESAFLKNNTSIYDFQLQGRQTPEMPGAVKTIKIKFETDTDPPLGFNTENKLMLLPFSFYVGCYSLPDLFAGKLHAVLFRQWKNRIKGRDWYDLEWYIKKGTPVNLTHFAERAMQSGELKDGTIFSHGDLITMLKARITALDVNQARSDVAPFIKNTEALKIWSKEYFLDLVERLTSQ